MVRDVTAGGNYTIAVTFVATKAIMNTGVSYNIKPATSVVVYGTSTAAVG